SDASAGNAASAYGLDDLPRVSDPDRTLYRAFSLERGSVNQLFGPRVVLRGVVATLRGHFVGALDGDGFQMPGVFLVADGAIVAAFRHRLASDRPDYTGIACDSGACAIEPTPAGAGSA
ncbi:MAG: AhpC/TSA family protein, partial [Phycisphaerales bacterium]